MRNQAARAARQLLGEQRRDDGRCGRSEDRRGRRRRIELRERREFCLEIFRAALLHVFGALHGVGQLLDHLYPPGRRIGIVDQSVPCQLVQRPRYLIGRRRTLLRDRIPHAHVPTRPRKNVRPRATNQPRADDSCYSIAPCIHLSRILSLSPPLRSGGGLGWGPNGSLLTTTESSPPHPRPPPPAGEGVKAKAPCAAYPGPSTARATVLCESPAPSRVPPCGPTM